MRNPLNLLLLINLCGKIADVLTTYAIVMAVGSTQGEANPVVKYTMDQLGVIPGLGIAFVIHMTAVYIIWRLATSINPETHSKLKRRARIGLYFMSGLISLVALNNAAILIWIY